MLRPHENEAWMLYILLSTVWIPASRPVPPQAAAPENMVDPELVRRGYTWSGRQQDAPRPIAEPADRAAREGTAEATPNSGPVARPSQSTSSPEVPDSPLGWRDEDRDQEAWTRWHSAQNRRRQGSGRLRLGWQEASSEATSGPEGNPLLRRGTWSSGKRPRGSGGGGGSHGRRPTSPLGG